MPWVEPVEVIDVPLEPPVVEVVDVVDVVDVVSPALTCFEVKSEQTSAGSAQLTEPPPPCMVKD